MGSIQRSGADRLGAQIGGRNANMVLLSNALSGPVSCYCIPTGVYCPVRACSSERWGPATYDRIHDQTTGLGALPAMRGVVLLTARGAALTSYVRLLLASKLR